MNIDNQKNNINRSSYTSNIIKLCNTLNMAVEAVEDLFFEDTLFPKNVVQGFLCLQESKILCDVVLVVEDKKISAHKVILAAASMYFRGMFCTGMKESGQNEIEIHNVDFDAMESVINFFYSSQIKLTENNIFAVMHIVDLFGISSLHSACCIFLMHSINVNNCVSVCTIASMYGYVDVYNAALYHTCKYFNRVLESEDFLYMGYETLIGCLYSQVLNLPNENRLVIRLCDWVKHDFESRSKHLESLLDRVNIYLIEITEIETDLYSLRAVGSYLAKWLDRSSRTLRNKDIVISSRNILRYANEQEVTICCGGYSSDGQLRNVDALQFGDIWRSMIPTALTQGTKLEPFLRVIPTMRTSRIYSAIAQTDKFVYAIGGRNENGPLNTIDAYDILNNEWVGGTELNEPVEGAAAVYMDGAIYLTGGFNNATGVTNKAWVLEKGSKMWKQITAMNEKRSHHGLVAIYGYIYAAGGAGPNGEVSSSLERYDIKAQKWQLLIPFQEPRSHFGFVSIDTKFYLIGGCSVSGEPLRSVQVYNTSTNQWQGETPLPIGTQSLGAAVNRGKIFVAAGSDGIHHLNNVYKFSPNTHIWHPMSSLNKGRIGLALATIRVPQLAFKL